MAKASKHLQQKVLLHCCLVEISQFFQQWCTLIQVCPVSNRCVFPFGRGFMFGERQFQSTLQLGGNRDNFPEGPRSSLPWYDNRVLPGRGHRCKRGENPPNAIAWDQFLAQNEWWCDGSWCWQSYLRYLYTVYIWAYSLSRGYCEDRWQLLEDPQEDWRHAWRFQRPQPRQFLFWKKNQSWFLTFYLDLARHVLMQTLSHVNATNLQTIVIRNVQHFTSLKLSVPQPRSSPFGTDCPKYRLLSADAVSC